METQATPVPTTQVAEKNTTTTYTFREITEADELKQAFRLRYSTYQKCCNIGFINSHNYKIDIDPYDFHSKHYGIFDENNVLVANTRVVLNRKVFQNGQVINMIGNNDLPGLTLDNHYRDHTFEQPDLPFLSYSNVPFGVKSHYKELISYKVGFAEVGRLIVREGYRGVKISAFLLDCIGVLFITICRENMIAFICCDEHHSSLYGRFGFKPMSDGKSYEVYGTNKLSLYLIPESLPDIYRAKFQGIAAEYCITGKIIRTI